MRLPLPRPSTPRRGVTLVEMLVTVALLILMMTIIVQVFQAATSAVSVAKTNQELDDRLRQLDITIRQDISPENLTANLIPPLNPKQGLGYFEYGENAFADLHGEDTDDYIRFTTRAPEGQLFTGRAWLPINTNAGNANNTVQPITITSQYAEIIYFLRNGNLYRRVFLVAPERQSSIVQPTGSPPFTTPPLAPFPFSGPAVLNSLAVSWQGMNDLSAHPSPVQSSKLIILNSLADLTNRENRPFYSRWGNDFNGVGTPPTALTGSYDGIADDLNPDTLTTPGTPYFLGDGIQDYLPGLYPQLFVSPDQDTSNFGNGLLVFESSPVTRTGATLDTMAFPYTYPGAYSAPDNNALNGAGWIHTPDPGNAQNSVGLLNVLNQAPLDLGDNLPGPSTNQTWWGFPTWRETLSPNWADPMIIVNGASFGGSTNMGQPFGLHPLHANVTPPLVWPGGTLNQWLPPMTTVFRPTDQLYYDGYGGTAFSGTSPQSATSLWNMGWEDDLIMTGVRSFDVKAFDESFAGYVDLGWGDDLRLYEPYRTGTNTPPATPPFLAGLPTDASGNPRFSFTWPPNGSGLPHFVYVDPSTGYTGGSMAHEGRIPPLFADFRADYQYPSLSFVPPLITVAGTVSFTNFNSKQTIAGLNNIGDPVPGAGNQNPPIVRLRRVWDTWSTDYALPTVTGYDPSTKQRIGPPYTPPVYPSQPPPYPAPLKGLQIQIRVVDPTNRRIKVLTIRQDFAKKQVSPIASF